jgi:hypothetical protein
LSIVFKSLCDLLSISLPFILWKYASQKTNVPQRQGKANCLIEVIKWKFEISWKVACL